MMLPCGKTNRPQCREVEFSAIGLTADQSTGKVIKKVERWLDLHLDNVIIWGIRSTTTKTLRGFAYKTSSCIFYEDAPR
jgi:hypothetical protein